MDIKNSECNRKIYFIIFITVIHISLCNAMVDKLVRSKRFLFDGETKGTPATKTTVSPNVLYSPMVRCDTCEYDRNCSPTVCATDETYCMNVVQFDENGNRAMIKKSCASYLECKFDHSNQDCVYTSGKDILSKTCQFCCLATNDTKTCNDDQIPSKVDWFGDTVPTTSTTVDRKLPRCDTCEYGEVCTSTVCAEDETYCINVVQFDEHGKSSVIKKTCANYLECKYDHSGQSCNYVNGKIIHSKTCEFCCLATNDSVSCNENMIPSKIDWFGDTTSTSSTTTSTTKSTSIATTSSRTTTEAVVTATSPHTSTVSSSTMSPTSKSTTTSNTISAEPTTTEKPSTKLSSLPIIPPSEPPAAISSPTKPHLTRTPPPTTSPSTSTTAIKSSTRPLFTSVPTHTTNTTESTTSVTKPLFTPEPNMSTSPKHSDTPTTRPSIPKSSTKKPPYTLPPVATSCERCSSAIELCGFLHEPTNCEPPNNYCINRIVNKPSGLREVNRTCGNFSMCYNEWFLGSSDNDKCRNLDENNVVTLDFSCTFCCIQNGCNKDLKPKDSTLYNDY